MARSRPVGRPTKRSPQVIAKILKTAATGMPLYFAAESGGVSLETLYHWCRQDPELEREIERARLVAAKLRWEQINKAAKGSEENPPNWQATAWQLERSYPRQFSRPEIQINQQTNNSTTNIHNEFTINVAMAENINHRVVEMEAEMEKLFQGRITNNGARGETYPE